MAEPDTKVIGYFAYMSATEVACDGDACIVAGSQAAIRRYLSISNPKNVDRYTVKKTRFGEIMKGMSLGAAYAFDRESYNRFYPLALEVGIPASPADFAGTTPDEIKFMTVRRT
ncbi:MAG: hypothetical protein GY835_28250 [bacterium]|nr:hypothetical protein [bacterium]